MSAMKTIIMLLLLAIASLASAQTASIVTENYLRLNFTAKYGITPGTENTLAMSCDQIKARYQVNISGATSTGARCPAQNELSPSFNPGDQAGGGIIGYVLQPGDAGYVSGENHALILHSGDLGQAAWAVGLANVTGADGTAIGTGSQNTADIVAYYPLQTSIAARICSDLTAGGYSDWYLPSRDELAKLYDNYAAGLLSAWFGTDYYWSSSEYSNSNAYSISFATGTISNVTKSTNDRVVAIRYH